MTASSNLFRLLNELDHVRIDRLLAQDRNSVSEALAQLLDDADIVAPADVPADVVTMYTRITVQEMPDGEQRTMTLCYPPDVDAAAGFVSVLSPIGTALLGRRAGEKAQWATPTGDIQRLRIIEVQFQPEASGDYTR